MILNSSDERLTGSVLSAVKEGTPYVGHGEEGCEHFVNNLSGLSTDSCNKGVDMLGFVEYPNVTMTNSTYVKEKDDVMYEHGTRWFTDVPNGAKVIVKNAGKAPLQGCIGLYEDKLKSQFEKYQLVAEPV